MPKDIRGIHHITAIASSPQINLDFYTQVLGLRLVKLTVNFDDPGTYHFYFGDETGHPGTILTFFPWPDIRRGKRGIGQVSLVGFRIPPGSLGFWQDYLKRKNITTSGPFQRFGEAVLTLADPDGMQIELVAGEGGALPESQINGPVPVEHAIRGFASPTLLVQIAQNTARLLQDTLGFKPIAQAGPRTRYRSGAGASIGSDLDLEERPDEHRGLMGAGIIHHIALRAENDEQQLEWRQILVEQGYEVTPVLDRQYFHSIYFREPGGILFEIATDPPGFTLDETVETLGSQLRLPPWLEPRRGELEQFLLPLKTTAPAYRNSPR